MRKFITQAIEQGRTPKRTGNESIILRNNNEFRVLVSTVGSLTKAGHIYEELANTELETFSFDPKQLPARNGNVESIKLRGGKERVVRTFDPTANDAKGEFRYTALGKKFFSKKQVEYIVRVPATFSGTRSNGQPYSREGFYPVHQPVSVPMTYTTTQRDAHIKRHVTSTFNDGIIAEYSQEQIKYRPTGQWSIVEMTTTPQDMEQPDVTDRPMAVHPASVSSLPFPEAIVVSAFEDRDDKLCCIRQIADITKQSAEDVNDLMDDCEKAVYGTDTWRERGCTSKMIFEYAKRTGRGACMIHGARALR